MCGRDFNVWLFVASPPLLAVFDALLSRSTASASFLVVASSVVRVCLLYLSRQHSGVSGAFLLCQEESCPGHICIFSFFMGTCVLDFLGS